MKKYRVCILKSNPEFVDLVNIEDESERIPAAPFEFVDGAIVTEDMLYFEEHLFVDDQTFGKMEFACLKNVKRKT